MRVALKLQFIGPITGGSRPEIISEDIRLTRAEVSNYDASNPAGKLIDHLNQLGPNDFQVRTESKDLKELGFHGLAADIDRAVNEEFNRRIRTRRV